MGQSRRDFIGGLLATGVAGCARPPGRRLAYSVPILGDTHFDSTDPKHYHSHYTHSTTEKRYKEHLAEHVRNAEMWKERMPALIRASGACLRGDEALVLQMGDLVQGDCGNAATHRRMLDDAFALVKGAYGNRLPLVTVVGNHDIRGDIKGDGALETFDAWQPPLMSKELGVPSHKLEYYDCVFPEGRITQFVFNSVWSKAGKENLHVIGRGAEEYGNQATGDGADVKEYRPFVRDYLFANAAGHYRMDVSDDRVEVAFYPGAATMPTETFKLR